MRPLLKISSSGSNAHPFMRRAYPTLSQRTKLQRTMSSTSTPPAPNPIAAQRSSSSTPNPDTIPQQPQPQDSPATTTARTTHPLPLPDPAGAATPLSVGGDGVRLDHLGPLVVNEDGTASRIANWAQMAAVEREAAVRILGRRNRERLERMRMRQE
ncbi:hypothetical protein F4779DRAFT_589380 [Xylariaceae sp. FL0662B]|nr:hypothetical protein F4779DRAFT_589380 [Xylariaceae sp. FL0662B]